MLNECVGERTGAREKRERGEGERERERERERDESVCLYRTCTTYSAPVKLKSIPPMVKEISGKELILEQSKVYCMKDKVSV